MRSDNTARKKSEVSLLLIEQLHEGDAELPRPINFDTDLYIQEILRDLRNEEHVTRSLPIYIEGTGSARPAQINYLYLLRIFERSKNAGQFRG